MGGPTAQPDTRGSGEPARTPGSVKPVAAKTQIKYHADMSTQSKAREPRNLASISAYLIIPAVGLPMLWTMFQRDEPTRWLASAMLAVFTLLFFFHERIPARLPTWGSYLYAACQTLLVTGLIFLPPGQLMAVILFFILSADVTMQFSQRVSALWIALFSVITLITYVALGGADAIFAVPIYVAGYIFFSTFAQQTARAEQARAESDRLLGELRAAHRQLQDYALQSEELAVQQERNRLAREMHDTLGHRLTVSSVQLQAAERLIATDPDRAREMVGTVREQIREGLGELRRTVATLRAPVEADLALASALQRLTAGFQEATGITVHLDVPGELPDLPAGHRHALYRGAQEGLTNVQRHAAAADAWVALMRRNGAVLLSIRDNGMGLDASAGDTPGFGLHGLRERAAQLDGTLVVGRAPEGGTEIVMSLPLRQENAHA